MLLFFSTLINLTTTEHKPYFHLHVNADRNFHDGWKFVCNGELDNNRGQGKKSEQRKIRQRILPVHKPYNCWFFCKFFFSNTETIFYSTVLLVITLLFFLQSVIVAMYYYSLIETYSALRCLRSHDFQSSYNKLKNAEE